MKKKKLSDWFLIETTAIYNRTENKGNSWKSADTVCACEPPSCHQGHLTNMMQTPTVQPTCQKPGAR